MMDKIKNPNDYLPLTLAREATKVLQDLRIDTDESVIIDSILDNILIKQGIEYSRNERERLLAEYQLMVLWSKNKQVYRFDKDFLDAIRETDNIFVSKSMLRHLPYGNMYFDLSDNEDLCNELGCKGIFFSVICLPYGYDITISTLAGNNDVPSIVDRLDFTVLQENEDRIVSKEEYIKQNLETGRRKREFAELEFIKMQLLCYLCSVEPDIQQDMQTTIAYKAPKNGNIKNVFTEVKIYETGVRYGNAFRKWKAERLSAPSSASGNTGSKKRPHYRRAHWSHFWYGHGDNKEKRPKWISEIMVGTGETVATIHKVG